MRTYDLVMDAVSGYLSREKGVKKIIKDIRSRSCGGGIAFYPCGRYSNMIVREIEKADPEMFSRILAFFDKSAEAKSSTTVDVRGLDRLPAMKDRISLIVICSNTFYEKEEADIGNISGYKGKILKTSYFDASLPTAGNGKILSDIEKVYNLLADSKSRMTYLVTWLSRALNDADLTHLFETERKADISSNVTRYMGYRLKGLGEVCASELHSELYSMRYVYPERGDIVLDIGGYKGDSAVFFASTVSRVGRVFSFEPVKKNYNDLSKNIKANRLQNIVEPINKGLSDRPSKMHIMSSRSGAPWSFVSKEEGCEEIELTTIDDFVTDRKLKRVDFIKMDVEGFEKKVLSGGVDTINRFRPKMAVPLYHNTSDLTALPLFINNTGKYEFYIRCKMEGPFAVNLYCKPFPD